MTPHEHLAEADRLIEEAAGLPMDQAVEHLTFAQLHIQISQAAVALGIREDLARITDISVEEAERCRAIRQAAAAS